MFDPLSGATLDDCSLLLNLFKGNIQVFESYYTTKLNSILNFFDNRIERYKTLLEETEKEMYKLIRVVEECERNLNRLELDIRESIKLRDIFINLRVNSRDENSCVILLKLKEYEETR